MDKKLERNIIWSLAIILIVLGLTSCASAPLKVMSKPIEETLSTRSALNWRYSFRKKTALAKTSTANAVNN